MKTMAQGKEWIHMLLVLSGVSLFAVSYCFFLTPAKLYSGGFTGISQIIKFFLTDIFGFKVSERIDITGIISWCLNIPLMFMGYHILGRKFFLRTAIAVCLQSFLITILPHPSQPLFQDNMLNCILGGALSGYGVGLSLREGGSGGGTDIVGMIFTKRHSGLSVGMISLIINIAVYTFAAIKYNLETAAYSLVFSLISTMIVDRVHYQNIKMTAFIVSRDQNLGNKMTHLLGRGVTSWKGWGEYTQHDQLVHMIVISKYELQFLKKYIREEDPEAFVFVVSPNTVIGKFERRLEVS